MPRLTQDEKDEITAAMVGVIDRYCGMDPIDMPLARELSAECCRLIEARERAQINLPVQLPEKPTFMDFAMRPQRGGAA